MPVRLSDKDKRVVVEPSGTVVKRFEDAAKAKAFVAARNMGERRSKGKPTPAPKRSGA